MLIHNRVGSVTRFRSPEGHILVTNRGKWASLLFAGLFDKQVERDNTRATVEVSDNLFRVAEFRKGRFLETIGETAPLWAPIAVLLLTLDCSRLVQVQER